MAIGIGRRQFISAVGGVSLAWPRAARAQQARWVRVGWLSIASHPFIEGFRRGMLDLGWREGDNFEIEQQYADGHAERLIDLATALVRNGEETDLFRISNHIKIDSAKAIQCCAATSHLMGLKRNNKSRSAVEFL
jgi:hypothetical protein